MIPEKVIPRCKYFVQMIGVREAGWKGLVFSGLAQVYADVAFRGITDWYTQGWFMVAFAGVYVIVSAFAMRKYVGIKCLPERSVSYWNRLYKKLLKGDELTYEEESILHVIGAVEFEDYLN